MAHSNIDRNVLNRTSYEVSKIFDYQIAALLETQKITGMVSQEVVEAVEDRKQISQLLDTLNDTTTEIATISKGVGRLEMATTGMQPTVEMLAAFLATFLCPSPDFNTRA
jgi:hypothetical protein